MPRAERSQDLGEIFRQKVESVLKPLRYEIIGSKYPIKCYCEYHETNEHTIDILARHLHSSETARRRTIAVESKKTLPSVNQIEGLVTDLANKIDCLTKKTQYSQTNEGLVVTDKDVSLNLKGTFDRASRRIAGSRDIMIALVSGSKFRSFEAMSTCVKNSSGQSSVTMIRALKKPENDFGSLCPLNVNELSRVYVCALDITRFGINIFKMDDDDYNSQDFVEDMQWVKDYEGVLDSIHVCEGFTDDAIRDIQATNLGIGLVDHGLERSWGKKYLNYQLQI